MFQAAPEGAGFASNGYATPGDALLPNGTADTSPAAPASSSNICFALRSPYPAGDDSAANFYSMPALSFRFIRTCSATPLAITWRTPAGTRARFSSTSATKTFRTWCDIPNWLPADSKTSGRISGYRIRSPERPRPAIPAPPTPLARYWCQLRLCAVDT